jgi:hypothetical protein
VTLEIGAVTVEAGAVTVDATPVTVTVDGGSKEIPESSESSLSYQNVGK